MDFYRFTIFIGTLCTLLTDVLSFKPIFLCDERRGMTEKQVKICFEDRKHMAYVIDAREIAKKECEKQFAGQRWNCTFPPAYPVPPLIKPKMELATREAAFVYALASAAIMHTVSRACMENKLSKYCGCSKENRPDDLPKSDLWNGCGDNLPYGYQFSKKFVDASETLANDDLTTFQRVLMNLHNNEAGRWAVFEKSRIQCRCHGVTKNCATKMCYRQLARFKEVGKRLFQLHQSSIQVKVTQAEKDNTEIKLTEKNPDFNKYTSKDLVYIEDSPSYCEKDLDYSIFGTKGRKCNMNMKTQSLQDCNVLCCGRGHHTRRETIREKCGCKFIWCCDVKCKICEKEQNVHYCK